MTTAKSPLYKLNNGIEMPVLGFGVFRSEPEETVAAVRSAVADGSGSSARQRPRLALLWGRPPP